MIAGLTGVTHAGELSVVVFFFLSGALVTKSLSSSHNGVFEFVVKRIMRIYPALIICCFLSAFVFSNVFGGGVWQKEIYSVDAWKYFFHNSIALWNEHFISGVYETHPEHGLNGSLWSVTLEIRLYFVLALLGFSGLLKGALGKVLFFSGIVIALGVDSRVVPIIGSDHASFGNYDFPVFSCVFLIGGLFYLLEKEFPINLKTVAVSIFLLICFKGSVFFKCAIFQFVAIFAIWFGTNEFIVKRVQLRNDYSYGVYLYGWPAQQIVYTLVSRYVDPKPWQISALAIPLALFFACLSWHFVEKPCISAAQKFKFNTVKKIFGIKSGVCDAV